MLDDMTGKQLDGYQLLELLGSGTFGAVYKAKDLRRNDLVAVKVMQPFNKQDEIDLFLDEISNLTRLRHPHIVPIRNGKIDSKTRIPYIAMEFAPNGTLRSRHKRGEQLPLATVVQYVTQIADALQFAHNDHLIHRDIKPENVLIGPNNELWLSDFGISISTATFLKAINSTVPVNSAGTPYYMAPEQFLGDLDKATDQYALAIMAYEWLTGYPPFTQGNFNAIGYQHTNKPLSPIHDKRLDIPQQVEAVIVKALAKKPKDRYGSVREFAQALEAAASKLPIGTLLMTLGGYAYWSWLYPTVAWSPDGTCLAYGYQDNSVRIWDVSSKQEIACLTRLSDKVVSLAWSPDGTRLAFSDLTNGHIWDVRDEREVMPLLNQRLVAWSPDGSRLAFLFEEALVLIQEVSSGRVIGACSGLSRATWSPDGLRLAGNCDRQIHILDIKSKREIFCPTGEHMASFSWSSDSTHLALVYHDSTIRIWDVTSGSEVANWVGHTNKPSLVAWSPDGTRLAFSRDGAILIWNAWLSQKLMHLVGHLVGHTDTINLIAWSPNGTHIASASSDKTVRIWDVATGREIACLVGHSDSVQSVAWSPDGTHIASASSDKTVRIWQAV